MNARDLTLHLLLRSEKNGAFSNIVLEKELSNSALNQVDKAFVTSLFYGVIEKKICLDYQLSSVLTKPIKKLKPDVLIILRMGAYQLLFMDKIPANAAINESVKLAKKHKCAYASGLVNACLRRIDRQGMILPTTDDACYLSVKYSVPQWLIDLWTQHYGADHTKGILASLSENPKTVVRVNTLLTDIDALEQSLCKSGIICHKNEGCENALVLEKPGDITALKEFQNGWFHVEDTAAQKAALLLGAKEGERVLDACAAPGGKSFTIAQQMKNGTILACDLYENRVGLIRSGAKRLHIDFIEAVCQDAACFNPALGMFDRVLCDVPCSGLGIIRRKPEIRYKSREEISVFPAMQLKILNNCYRYLKPGGTLVYSTCTLNTAENEEVIADFERHNNKTAKVIFQKTFLPHTDQTDGFFAAVIEKHE